MTFNFTEAEFDLWAPHYDEDAKGRTRWVAHDRVSETVAQHAAEKNVKKIIDLGAGTGLLIPTLKSIFASAAIVAVDQSGEMLKMCKEKGIADTLEKFDLTREDWTPLQKHGKAGIVVSSGVMEFIPDSQSFIANAANLLEDGGLVAITYQPPQISKGPIGASPTYAHSKQNIIKDFKNAGLEVLEHRDFPAYQHYGNSVYYGLVCAHKPG